MTDISGNTINESDYAGASSTDFANRSTEELASKNVAAAIADMRLASNAVDEASGSSDYQTRLVALALIARYFLRELELLPVAQITAQKKEA